MSNVKIPVPLAALQDAIKAQTSTPADVVADAGRVMVDTFKAYQDLKVLTTPLNGLPDSAPIPENLKFDEIVVNFRLNGEHRTVKLHTVQRAGDLYRLLLLEGERLVSTMRQQAALAQTNAATIEAACSKTQYTANAQQNPGSP